MPFNAISTKLQHSTSKCSIQSRGRLVSSREWTLVGRVLVAQDFEEG